ncbi:MAG: hypothetical protein QOE92_685 [Chloroflexota bacterium]|jgi:murein DD-endopeptidase MepM/ murein hydrolase activator NlpD|nr:hypothetical protein [Chloroflexota bacterium]
MPRIPSRRAIGPVIALVALLPAAASAAVPSPSPSPSAASRCQVPQGMESDPEEQVLLAQCLSNANRVEDQKTKLNDSLSLAQGSAMSLQDMLAQTRQAIKDNRAEQDKTRARIHDLQVQEAQTAQQITATQQRLEQRRSEYAAFVRLSYKYQPNLFEFIVQSRGISDFLDKASALTRMREYGVDLLRKIHDEEDRLQAQRDQLNHDHQEAQARSDELVKAQQDLIDSSVREAGILAQLNASISSAKNALAMADGQSADLVARIVAQQIARQNYLIQQANDAAWEAARAWMASNNASFVNSTGHTTKYPFLWPAQKGTISQWFGPTDFTMEPPAFGAAHFHAGIDIAYKAGTPVLAADDGVVVAAEDSKLNGQLIGYGRHVIIAHRNGMMTLYGHLDGYPVKVGDRVQQGQMIGVMGSTGMSTGPHLHFELRINNTPTDPKPYLPPNGPNDFRG